MNSSKILVTGATGFLGSLLVVRMKENGLSCISAVRDSTAIHPQICVGEIGPKTDWTSALVGVDVVIHLAARAHVMVDEEVDPLAIYRRVNVGGTENLAKQSATAGVKRFIFISSVKVNGESTTGFEAFSESHLAAPEDPYGLSKLEAEDGLRQVAKETGMEVVIIRPPLIYGVGVKANFLSLLKLASTPFPLPFGSIDNRRSMIYAGNLVDFIIKCVDYPAAANQTFLISDGDDVSLRSLITLMRSEFGRPPRLFSIPIALFKLVGLCMGRKHMVDRLVGDLQIDSSKARNLLKWEPPYSVERGIAATVQDFKDRSK